MRVSEVVWLDPRSQPGPADVGRRSVSEGIAVDGHPFAGVAPCTPADAPVAGRGTAHPSTGAPSRVAHPAVDLYLQQEAQGFDPGPGVRGDW